MAARGRTMSRFWPDDEEMAKKDDDIHAPGHGRQGQWQAAGRVPRRRFVARIATYAAVAFMVVFVLHRLTSTSSDGPSYGRSSSIYPPGLPPRGGKQAVQPARTYDGPARFPDLPDTLRAIAATGGNMFKNRNVLFAAASLRSAATLLPMACQMAEERQNYVHFALMSRSDIPMGELLKINGIDDSCQVLLHDARPDSPTISTETRMMLASARALHHINMFMHPQAVVVDSTSAEEDYFLKGIRDQIRATRSALIELPDRPHVRVAWLKKLDASALSAWNKVHFDIMIQSSPTGSGNLRRLLQSLRHADFGALSMPHLTIELPSVIEDPLEKLLFNFQWPPYGVNQPRKPQMLSLRHRIPRRKMNAEESSVRFLESFWPSNPAQSHVLILSPHTEITPQFFGYVKYSLLKYRYSAASVREEWDEKLMGISFQSPSTLLDETTPLPVSSDDTPYLWQVPTSDAVLFFGEKWVELHGYVSQVLEKQLASTASPALLAHKEFSKQHPSWLEYALQLSRIRGYFTLYPTQGTAGAILGVHTDLYDPPEEYYGDEEVEDGEAGEGDRSTEVFDAGSQVDVLNTLPQGGALPPLGELPLLALDGKRTDLAETVKVASKYAQEFRRQVGQCKDLEGEEKPEKDEKARDLFCSSTDMKEQEKEEAAVAAA